MESLRNDQNCHTATLLSYQLTCSPSNFQADMWDYSDATPPASPTVRIYRQRTHLDRSETRQDRSSTYYKNISKRRGSAQDDAVEEAHGWSGNAAAIKATNKLHQSDQMYSSIGHGISLKALIDPKDVENKHRSAGIPISAVRRRKKRTVHSILRRLFRLACKGAAENTGTITRPSTVYDAAEEMERNRRSRHQFLESRKARGSIMYEKDTGIAQIPLYAAPATAEVSSAPALSSFAPRAPLQPRNLNKALPSIGGSKTIAEAKASATIDRDGNILEVKKEKGFARGNARYSAFVQGQRKGLVVPSDSLPVSRAASPLAGVSLYP